MYKALRAFLFALQKAVFVQGVGRDGPCAQHLHEPINERAAQQNAHQADQHAADGAEQGAGHQLHRLARNKGHHDLKYFQTEKYQDPQTPLLCTQAMNPSRAAWLVMMAQSSWRQITAAAPPRAHNRRITAAGPYF